MNILIVGNVIKDIYLNLDPRTETFETDKSGTNWLDLSFDASEHRFFHRECSFGGSAITLEVLNKLNLTANISGSDFKFEPDGPSEPSVINTHRYILIHDGQVCYLTPTKPSSTPFATPSDFYDYLYIDRSANLTQTDLKKIQSYLNLSSNTKLILYLHNPQNHALDDLLPRANLIFCENLNPLELQKFPKLQNLDPKKLVFLSEKQISYLNIQECISIHRIDMLTHLSAYSIASATILGSFILGHSVEDSLRMARANVENSTLNATLTLPELQDAASKIKPSNNLELIAANLVLPPKGILAADESGGSIHKKFDQLGIPDTYNNRRDYRNLFFTTPDLENYVNGVILFDETARQQADNGQNFVDYLTAKRIIPGIKVDQGLAKFDNSVETYTKGLDNLFSRLTEYRNLGLRFAKWRAAFEIHLDETENILTPTNHAITENCRILAEYAKECQKAGLVPIVEPEVVYDGFYPIEKSASVTGQILDCLFKELQNAHVNLKACLLKTSMVLAGKQSPVQSTPAEIGQATAKVLKDHVPSELAGIVFLSGGQTPEQATDNLAAIIQNGPYAWPVTFSFARALQDPALYAWQGNNSNADTARMAFKTRLIANCDALKK